MPLPPLWKVKRELRRIGTQIHGVFMVVRETSQRAVFEATKSTTTQLFEGDRPAQSKYLIYVIYEPDGVLDSTLETCRYFEELGYAPIVISNARISEMDRERLMAVSMTVIQRENFGYDFGAYRDALRYLRDKDATPETVILMNDSIWFPIVQETDLIARLEEHSADLAGPVYEVFGHRKAHQFLHSYMMRISASLFQDQVFWDFWDNLILTNIKTKVVRGGEMRLSEMLEASGRHVEGLLTTDDVHAQFKSLPPEELAEVIDAEMRIDPKYALELKELHEAISTSGNPDSVELKDRRYMPQVHPRITIDRLEVPFAKKDRAENYVEWRREFFRLVDTQPAGKFRSSMLDEMRIWDAPEGNPSGS